jgi:hypothetical protein
MEDKRGNKNEKEREHDYKEEEKKSSSWWFEPENFSKTEIDLLLKAGREMESPLMFKTLP